ncbi:hypothetical protein QCA50_020528 [Cerrena zonata]|uniref:Uncharacterized protein n=1 Tax=Cerrena zonata TaxID=2478898 RepID=A0AAW0FIQ8_9APHY
MMNGQPIQNIARPQLSWEHSWSHDWNKGMLSLLAQQFIADIKDGSHPLLPPNGQTPQQNVALLTTYVSTLTSVSVRHFIEGKLKRTQAAYRLRQKAPSEDVFQVEFANKKRKTAIADRHGSIRQLLYKRCCEIVQKQNTNTEPWKAILEILNLLKTEGMSSDETETESPKRVRRIQLAFLHRDFADLFAALDSYPQEGVVLKKDQRGNRHLEQIRVSVHVNKDRLVH